MFLILDTETGGLDKNKHGLLTSSFLLCDQNLQVLDSLDLQHQTVENLLYDPVALKINGIDLENHRGKSREENFQLLQKFLNRNQKLVAVGHNLGFDLGFIWNQLCPFPIWCQYVGPVKIDTLEFFRTLMTLEIVKSPSCKLTDLAISLGLLTHQAHTARGDAHLCLELLRWAKRFS